MENQTRRCSEQFKVGDRVLYTERQFKGAIRTVHTGILTGMYEVQLDRGSVCTEGSELIRAEAA
jgi:hypothetical protein